MGRYYQLDKEEGFYTTREEESIYGCFANENPFYIQKALKRTDLHQAVCNSDYDEADFILNLGKTQVNQRDIHGNTALHLAIVNQQSFPAIYAEIIRLLREHGAKDDLKNNYGQTPLDLEHENLENRKKYALMFDLPPYQQSKELKNHPRPH